tara:strand:- start:643 stop:879 length:237 start_codon:yes stop_codon:yes gene_type:complete
MSRVSELIDLIVQGKNAEASDVLNQELMSRSYSAINDIKPEVAANYFAPVVDYGDGSEEPEYETSQTTQEEPSDETDS